MAIKCPKCQADNPDTLKYCGECGTQLTFTKDISSFQTETLQVPIQELARGSVLAGRYEIIEELGKGGMGRVYKVFDIDIKEKVALKLLKPEISSDRETIERFSNELKFARKIRHKNVCGMYDLGKAEGTSFITMEYISGEDLKSMIRMTSSLTIGATLSIGKQICDGLAEAHALGIVHRDLKPQNVMIDKGGNAKIMDFGIARSIREKGITGPSVLIGTPEYMSPEQAEAKEVDYRSDIYSLGIILYEMATGRVPFEGETALSIAMKHKGEIPKNPKQFNPNIPDGLSSLILKCLEKDKARRYQTASEARSELEELEKGLPTMERIVPEKKTFTSKEITVTLSLKRLVLPALGLLFVVLAALTIWKILPKKEAAPEVVAKRSIAVLPFEDLSPEKGQEILADGIPETLINSLSSLEGLHVSARTSSFFFKGKQTDVREIGQKLGVETVLEGSIQVAGNRLRIMLRLIDIADGFQIWSDDYDKTLDDIFAVQDDIALSVVRALKIKLIGEDKEQLAKGYTVSREAYTAYLQGRYFWEKRGQKNTERAIEYFKKAIEQDPTYALAYTGIADSYQNLGNSQAIPPKEAFPRAIAAARKALELNDKLAEAHVSLAMPLFNYNHNFPEAEKGFKVALELKPGYATAHHWYAFFLTCMGRHEEAIKEIELARDLDPLSLQINANVGGFILYYARQFDQALEELMKSTELFPEHYQNYAWLSRVYVQLGRYEEARKATLRFNEMGGGRRTGAKIRLTYIDAISGNRGEAQKGLKELLDYSERDFVSPLEIARIYTSLGEKDQAFIWLDRALSENDARLVYLKVCPEFDPLRSDPRYGELLKKIGFK